MYFQRIMCSQEFWNELNGTFKMLTYFFPKKCQFFISNFLHIRIPKRRRIWGMSQAAIVEVFSLSCHLVHENTKKALKYLSEEI